MSGEDSLRGVKRFLWILLIAAVILAIWGVVSRVRGREQSRPGDFAGGHPGRPDCQAHRQPGQ